MANQELHQHRLEELKAKLEELRTLAYEVETLIGVAVDLLPEMAVPDEGLGRKIRAFTSSVSRMLSGAERLMPAPLDTSNPLEGLPPPANPSSNNAQSAEPDPLSDLGDYTDFGFLPPALRMAESPVQELGEEEPTGDAQDAR